MGMRYAREKTWDALRHLALGTGDLQGRLYDAYAYALMRMLPDRDLDDDELRKELAEIRDRLTTVTDETRDMLGRL